MGTVRDNIGSWHLQVTKMYVVFIMRCDGQIGTYNTNCHSWEEGRFMND